MALTQKMKALPMDDTEIRLKGIQALNNTLGPTAALGVLTLLHGQYKAHVEIFSNYTKIKV